MVAICSRAERPLVSGNNRKPLSEGILNTVRCPAPENVNDSAGELIAKGGGGESLEFFVLGKTLET